MVIKYLFAVLVLITGALGWMYFGIGVPEIYRELKPEVKKPHLYDNPEREIDRIRVFSFYFVPKNKSSSVASDWHSILESNLSKAQIFHSLQFRGLSEIEYAIFPEPVLGLENNLFYDTAKTDRGNPQALLNVAEELQKRVFNKSGDLFREEFASVENGAYPVMLIIYEGVGAVGGIIRREKEESRDETAKRLEVDESLLFEVDVSSVDGFSLLSSAFLTRNEFKKIGSSIMTHEFYHTLGLPDAYEVPGTFEVVLSDDITGAGRKRPLERTYLSRDNLKKLGL